MMGILEHKGNEMQLFFAEVILGRRTSQSFYRQRKFRRRPASIAQARKAERPDLRHENWRLNGKDGSTADQASDFTAWPSRITLFAKTLLHRLAEQRTVTIAFISIASFAQRPAFQSKCSIVDQEMIDPLKRSASVFWMADLATAPLA
ncbi:hypothetical protein [Sphingobium yanoikuyae]|uniref:hypothetical protein n=1 Tax=Sphingobium yanoikuyae TaxID=13690 RepID=UPI0035C850C1